MNISVHKVVRDKKVFPDNAVLLLKEKEGDEKYLICWQRPHISPTSEWEIIFIGPVDTLEEAEKVYSDVPDNFQAV